MGKHRKRPHLCWLCFFLLAPHPTLLLFLFLVPPTPTFHFLPWAWLTELASRQASLPAEREGTR